MKHPLLLIAGGLAVLCCAPLVAAIPFIVADPESSVASAVGSTIFVALIDLGLGGLLLVKGYRANRDGAVALSAISLIAALFFGLFVLDGAVSFTNHAYAGARTTEVMFFTAVVGNGVVALLALLELISGIRKGQKTPISGA